MSGRSSSLNYQIEPWRSKSDAVIAQRRRMFGSPTMWTLICMVGVLVGMAPFVTVDRTVTSTAGKVVATEAMTTFQALDPSIIASIDVKEGEEVAKGRLLATLDPTFAAADVGQIRRQMGGLDALIARAQAEQTGAPFGPAAPSSDPYIAAQTAIFAGRAAQLRVQSASFDEKIKAAQAAVVRVQADAGHLADRVNIARQIEAMRVKLYKSGSTSLLNLLQADDASIEMTIAAVSPSFGNRSRDSSPIATAPCINGSPRAAKS